MIPMMALNPVDEGRNPTVVDFLGIRLSPSQPLRIKISAYILIKIRIFGYTVRCI